MKKFIHHFTIGLRTIHSVGADPYDGLNTKNGLLLTSRMSRLILSYFIKFSPINFRKILRVQSRPNNKAVALICRAIIRQPIQSASDIILQQHIEYILSQSLYKDYGYYCWNANNFPIQTIREYQMPTVPGIIGTEACASAIFDYYRYREKRKDLEQILINVRDFFLNELLVRNRESVYFKYKPISKEYECIYNASLIAAKYIAKIDNYFNLHSNEDIVHSCFRFVISKQNKDGSWYYGLNLKTGYQKKQIDFHQGFILDAILEYLDIVDHKQAFLESYLKGLDFYYQKQFNRDGKSYYRYPRKYPIDIHNQAQGIITFVKAGKIDKKYMTFAKKIANWTTREMRSTSGYFYYQKFPFVNNKIPYIRWGQAWMLYALAILLHNY